MNSTEFIQKWQAAELKERSASQSHFLDLCKLLDIEDPISADPKGDWFTFERGASKTSGGEGWADVWRKGCFAWEYKGKKKDLDKAFDQLLRYSIALENPPLLIVSDMARFRVHTNWTNTVQQVHEFELHDLLDAKTRDLLRNCFLDPEQLRPAKTRQALTEEAAQKFASLAQRLRTREHDAGTVAHFVNRLVFCMFAEDVDLLPNKMFQKMLELCQKDPTEFQPFARDLFAAMQAGGRVGFEKVEWFNGGLFDNDISLPLEKEDLADLLIAAKLDWSEIDPSILGTLFERGLDPDKRSQLGAHYTDRDKIMQIVTPVIAEPLLAEWAEVKADIEKALAKAQSAKSRSAQTKAEKEAERLHAAFLERLRGFRVLDPACGSGNFLYLSLLALKDIEHRTNLEAEALGLPRGFPTIGPECVKGIELNPYAAELARVSVWVGEIQWMRRNGFDAARNPILRPLETIENRDAIVNEDGSEAHWPDADVILGNPPFLGAKWMLDRFGEEYTKKLRSVLPPEFPTVNLVTYWFFMASRLVQRGTKRVGFVSTNMIRSPVNAFVADFLYRLAPIKVAWSNEEWVVDGADVRVSLVVCDVNKEVERYLDRTPVSAITSELKAQAFDLGDRKPLTTNVGKAVRGIEKGGPFDLNYEQAEDLLRQPTNPNGLWNKEVVKRYLTVSDIVGRGKDGWIVDFHGKDEISASHFEAPFGLLEQTVVAARSGRLATCSLVERWSYAQAW